ncbi:MAG: hypothetical protein K5911_01435 [Eubacteriales bacterium]|nr:hypothetical protein [Eubacteriales bacterium]
MSKFDDLVSKNAREKEANDIRAAAAAEKELQEKTALKDWYMSIIKEYLHDFRDTVMRNPRIGKDELVYNFILGIEIVRKLRIVYFNVSSPHFYGLCVDNGKIVRIHYNAYFTRKGYAHALLDGNVKEDEIIDVIYRYLNPETKDEAEKKVYEYFADIINKYTK